MLSFVSYAEPYQSIPRPGPVQVSVNTQNYTSGDISHKASDKNKEGV